MTTYEENPPVSTVADENVVTNSEQPSETILITDDQLEARLEALEKNLKKILEATNITRLIKKPAQQKFIGLSKVVSKCYQSNGEVWDLSDSIMKNEHNKKIFEDVEKLAFDTSYFKEHMMDQERPTTYKSYHHKRCVHKVIRGHYEYLKKVKNKEKLPQDKKDEVAIRQKYRARLNKKYNKRVITFKKYEEKAIAGFGTKKECETLLDKDLMSDEEDGEVRNGNVAITIRTMIPEWRSEKLNAFYDNLEELHTENLRDLPLSKPRTFRFVNTALPTAKRAKLPAWSIKSGY